MDVRLFKADFKSLLSEGFDAEEEAVSQPQVRHPFLRHQDSLQGGLSVRGVKGRRGTHRIAPQEKTTLVEAVQPLVF